MFVPTPRWPNYSRGVRNRGILGAPLNKDSQTIGPQERLTKLIWGSKLFNNGLECFLKDVVYYCRTQGKPPYLRGYANHLCASQGDGFNKRVSKGLANWIKTLAPITSGKGKTSVWRLPWISFSCKPSHGLSTRSRPESKFQVLLCWMET